MGRGGSLSEESDVIGCLGEAQIPVIDFSQAFGMFK